MMTSFQRIISAYRRHKFMKLKLETSLESLACDWSVWILGLVSANQQLETRDWFPVSIFHQPEKARVIVTKTICQLKKSNSYKRYTYRIPDN